MKRKKEQWKPNVTSYREVTENNETINETRLEEQTA